MTARGRAAAVMAALAAVVAVIVVLIVVSGDGDTDAIVFTDGVDDCREPGRDFGDRCDAGADVLSMAVIHDGPSLTLEVELVEAPPLAADGAWRIQINVAATAGRVCGISNVVDEGEPGEVAVAYGFDPDFGLDPLTRRALEPGLCVTTLDDRNVRFVVDIAGQDPAEELRVAGFTRLEYLDDPDQPGSEDDFGFRSTLDALG